MALALSLLAHLIYKIPKQYKANQEANINGKFKKKEILKKESLRDTSKHRKQHLSEAGLRCRVSGSLRTDVKGFLACHILMEGVSWRAAEDTVLI